MKLRYTLLVFAGMFVVKAAHADCPQSIYEVVVNPTLDYFVVAYQYDNRLEVYLNGQEVRVWRLPGDAGPSSQDISSLFKHQRSNTLEIKGWNEAYGVGWHDPNPGDIEYGVTGVGGYKCTMADWRGDKDYLMLDHTYTFIDSRYPGAVLRPRHSTKADSKHLAHHVKSTKTLQGQ